MANGGAMIAYQGLDGYLYWNVYTGGHWSLVAPFSTPNVSIATGPTVAQGIGIATAELVFIRTLDNKAYHSQFITGGWRAPVMVSGTVVGNVAVASFSAKPTYDVTIRPLTQRQWLMVRRVA